MKILILERTMSRYFYIILCLCPCHDIPSGFKDYSCNLSPKLGLSYPSASLFTELRCIPGGCTLVTCCHWHHRATLSWLHLSNTIMSVWTCMLRSAAASNVISTTHSFLWVKVDNFLKAKFKSVEHHCSIFQWVLDRSLQSQMW